MGMEARQLYATFHAHVSSVLLICHGSHYFCYLYTDTPNPNSDAEDHPFQQCGACKCLIMLEFQWSSCTVMIIFIIMAHSIPSYS
jgi:hypothetical protein